MGIILSSLIVATYLPGQLVGGSTMSGASRQLFLNSVAGEYSGSDSRALKILAFAEFSKKFPNVGVGAIKLDSPTWERSEDQNLETLSGTILLSNRKRKLSTVTFIVKKDMTREGRLSVTISQGK